MTEIGKYNAIDSIRGIFALMIVWHHMAPIYGISYHSDFGNTIVLFFFILSGFNLTLSRINKGGSIREFYIRRYSKIYPLQWITCILYVIFGINVVTYWAVPFHMTLTQSLLPFWEINFTLNVPSWFLSSLALCYLVAPYMIDYATENYRKFIVWQVVAIVLYSLLIYSLPETIGKRWIGYINPFARIVDFSVGISIAMVWQKEEYKRKMKHP